MIDWLRANIDLIETWLENWMPGWLVPIAFELFLTAVFIMIVFLISRHREKKFWKRVEEREVKLAGVQLSTGQNGSDQGEGTLVHASIVVGQGHYRRLVAGLRKVIGGEVKAYGDLHERARREAVNRLKEAARARGAERVINLRFATSGLVPLDHPGMIHAVEITAYGTAVVQS